jgi:hypothetical protein
LLFLQALGKVLFDILEPDDFITSGLEAKDQREREKMQNV